MDARIDDYFRQIPCPLGSTDRKSHVAVDSVYVDLNDEQSEIAVLWTEKEVTGRKKTLGGQCGKFEPTIYGDCLKLIGNG